MSDRKPADRRQVDRALSDLFRVRHNANRVHWVQSTSLDPAVRRQDRDDLNAALRRAAGHTPPDDAGDEQEPGSYPWRSLSDDGS